MAAKLILQITPLVANLLMLGLLVFYRLRRKFPKERFSGLWAFLDANVVELVFALILVPDVARLVMALLDN